MQTDNKLPTFPERLSTSGAVPGAMKGNIDPIKLQAMRVQVGEWLREKRKEKGWSQQELADKMWIRQDTVSSVESGKWAISIDMLTLFCHHLNIPLKKIFANA